MKYNGLYMCHIEFGNDNMIYKKLLSQQDTTDLYKVSSPMIKFLYNIGCVIKPVFGIYGKHSRGI